MNLPIAQKARILQARNQPQHARLLAKLQMILKADQVIAVGAQILLAQLHHGPGRPASPRVAQANRLHRAEAQCIAAAPGQHLDGQAALEIVQLLPLFRLGRFGRQQRIEKTVVLRAIHRAVDVIGRSLVPARGKVDALHVDRVGLDDRRDRVVERQMPRAGDALDLDAQSL